jgi:hypothetical protein
VPDRLAEIGKFAASLQRHEVHSLSRRFRVLAGIAFAGTLLIFGCSRRVEAPELVAIKYDISPAPARVGPAAIEFTLIDAAGSPVNGAKIIIEAGMSHPGMRPLFAEANEQGFGRYRAHLEFPMAGDWFLLLHVTLRGGNKFERQIEVRGVRPN